MAAVGLIVTAGLALAACGGNQSGSSGGMAGMDHGGSSQSATPTGKDLDKAFLQGMVPHHQAAIDMAQAEVRKGKDLRVKEMAQAVITDQTREQGEMDQIAKQTFGVTPARSMTGATGQLMGVPITMDMSKMGSEVDTAADPDQTFLRLMIPHHATAISMADEEARNGATEPVKSIARGIVAAQAREIGQMQALLG
ncbi:MAG: hypothetical protein DLM67_13405 [Candidatus Nephthysia bennettiae]|nr:MAG: hypothetical protein DLM67_13405 [Candidatus Dormibacteraeota bacterium]